MLTEDHRREAVENTIASGCEGSCYESANVQDSRERRTAAQTFDVFYGFARRIRMTRFCVIALAVFLGGNGTTLAEPDKKPQKKQ